MTEMLIQCVSFLINVMCITLVSSRRSSIFLNRWVTIVLLFHLITREMRYRNENKFFLSSLDGHRGRVMCITIPATPDDRKSPGRKVEEEEMYLAYSVQ